MAAHIYAGVEGDLDAAVAARLVTDAGASVAAVHGRGGKPRLLQQLHGFNAAAAHSPWLVLVDLDDDQCAPPAVGRWLPSPASHMCFRVVIREIESWLLADRARFATFLGVSRNLIPVEPESVGDPKGLVVRLAQRSRNRRIREAMIPDPAGKRKIGPGYTAELVGFVQDHWMPTDAAVRADSLARCLVRLRELLAAGP